MNRTPVIELLDSDAGTPSEVAGSLADLRWFNRWFGGIATGQHLLERVANATKRTSFSLLEVAAGSGDVPRAVRHRLAAQGIQLEVTLLDRRASHVGNGNHTVVGDALALPFCDESFDLVGSGLFVHHLSPSQVVQYASEALRVCRLAMLTNDLIRHRLHLAVAQAGIPIYRSRLTRHDAPGSVRQAYTIAEMRDLVQKAGPARIEIERHYFFRMGLIAWKK
jgi:ubiquinone/menaquinone biosynthesis C-methylase UbiE